MQASRLFVEHAVEPSNGTDEELARVGAELRRLDPQGARTARVLRETLDQLLDGQRTGRFDYDDLRKTEKTHMGTLVEINLHREFEFEDGLRMDYRIAGVDVDCKFSQQRRGWQIPLEATGHLCLLIWADDHLGRWSAGLVRIEEDILRGGNRDRKRTLSDEGLRRIECLWRDEALAENVLLNLDPGVRRRILSSSGRRGGQTRTDELFRAVQGRLISRTTVLTVAQQDDAPKRVRDSRLRLRAEGIIVLGHQGDHPRVARGLALPVPSKGQWVSARILPREPANQAPSVTIRGVDYRLAEPDDPVEQAPLLDSQHEQL